MTADLRVILLVAMLVLAGCMPAKQAQGPASAEPGAPSVSSRDDGDSQASASSSTQASENSSQTDDIDPLDTVQGRENLPEFGILTAEEQKILDTEISFHVGLDTKENADVQRYFHYYTHLHRGTMEGWLKRAQPYLPHIRERFLAEGLPEDLIYLPFAESGFNSFALSSAGACGMWQFMPQTGINYGLMVDAWVDERRDPYKSTEAAIGYLKKLYGDFGDWSLALAAYNAGEGAIGRALEKTGCDDYFTLCATSADLKQETKLYVPKFLALVKVAKNLEKLGFMPIDWDKRATRLPILQAKPGTDLYGLAKSIGMDWKTFRELNPVFRKQEAPPSRSVQVAIPGHLVASAEDFLKRPVVPKPVEVAANYKVKKGDTWWRVAAKHNVSVEALQECNTAKTFKVGQTLRIPGRTLAPAVGKTVAAEAKKWAAKRANYLVRQGDTVWSIARQFKTDPSSLLQANGLTKNSALTPGQKIFVPEAGSLEVQVAKAQAEVVRKELVSYQVRPGDTVWNISKRFGVTPTELRQWNKLADNSPIRPGDQLMLYKR